MTILKDIGANRPQPSITPAPGMIPVADARGRIPTGWLARANDIGIPGTQGFGVGICPALPADYSEMPGTNDPSSANYGNYLHTSGAIEVWIPAHFYQERAGNLVDIKPISAYFSIQDAADRGYALDRTFIDGGEIQEGIFVDKYGCSNNDGIAVSKPLQPPLSSHPYHNPFGSLNGSPWNYYAGAFAAVKTRGQRYFPVPRYVRAMLARLSRAHGQESTSDTFCAWYDPARVKNFPKGNNTALSDVNDPTVTFTSDGFDSGGASMPALTGSGSNLAKTTHNGQPCGVADLNGNMYEITPGLTCIAWSKPIAGVSLTNPVVLTIADHGSASGDYIQISGIDGTTEMNNRIFRLTVIDDNTVSLDSTDGSAFTPYVSGGSATIGAFYMTKQSWKFADYTGGNMAETDHWGAAGVANTMQRIDLDLATVYPNNSFSLRFGNAAEQVMSLDVSGDGYLQTCLGLPAAGGTSPSGTNLYGQDWFYQYVRNELCPISGLYWNSGSLAGVWGVYLNHPRALSDAAVGVRAASYLVP